MCADIVHLECNGGGDGFLFARVLSSLAVRFQFSQSIYLLQFLISLLVFVFFISVFAASLMVVLNLTLHRGGYCELSLHCWLSKAE